MVRGFLLSICLHDSHGSGKAPSAWKALPPLPRPSPEFTLFIPRTQPTCCWNVGMLHNVGNIISVRSQIMCGWVTSNYPCAMCSAQLLSRVWLFLALETIACQAPLSMGFPGKNTRVACHALLQGIFQAWGLSQSLLHLPHCRWTLYTSEPPDHLKKISSNVWLNEQVITPIHHKMTYL